MAEKVYQLVQARPKEARWQLSEEEGNSLFEKAEKALDEVGGKMLFHFRTYSSQWRGILLRVFPDMEAYHKYTLAIGPQGLNVQRYYVFEVTLGYEPPT
jgi:hypothetical protein